MNYQYPDRITVEETEEIEVVPKYAVLEIVIEGESSVFGNEAFKKSKELVLFISELKSIDYSEENVSLENISIQTSSGKILKSSKAKFTLILDKVSLDLIPKILAIISNQKNIEISEMDYEYVNLSEEKEKLYEIVCSSSKRQGERISASFGVTLISVYSMNPKWSLPYSEAFSQNYGNSGMRMSKTRGIQNEELEGLDFITNYKGKLSLQLKVEFRVSEFK